jgi:hypothetical protein
MIRSRHVARIRKNRNAYRFLLRKPEGKSPLGRQRLRWMNLGVMGWGDVDLISLVQNMDKCRALVNAVMNLWTP